MEKVEGFRARALARRRRRGLVEKRKFKSKTVPDMALSVTEIVHRFTRGLPLDDVQREGVYVDQSDDSDIDYERFARASFDEKRELAQALQAEREALAAEVRRRHDELARNKAQAEAQRANKAAAPEAGEGEPALARPQRSEGRPLSRVAGSGTLPAGDDARPWQDDARA